MLQLAVVLFVKGITKVVDNAAQKTLADEPSGANKVPNFFSTLLLVGGCGVGDGWVVGCLLAWDGVSVGGCELVVLVES